MSRSRTGTATSPAGPTRSGARGSRPTSRTSSPTHNASGRRGRRDHAVELAADAAQLEARPGPRGRLHDRRQAERPHPGLRARAREADRRGRLPARRRQRHHRLGARGRTALERHPGVDRIAFTGSTKAGKESPRRRRPPHPHHARARRQVRPDRVRPMPTSRPPRTASSAASSPPRGRRAWPAPGCWCKRMSPKRSTSGSSSGRADQTRRPARGPTEMGPVANQRQFETVTGILEYALEQGATAVYGGGPIPSSAAVRPADGAHERRHRLAGRSRGDLRPCRGRPDLPRRGEAIAMANGTEYGLAGSVWTNDIRRANASRADPSGNSVDQRLPRRGPQRSVRRLRPSGMGRENGIDVMREYTENRSIWIETSARRATRSCSDDPARRSARHRGEPGRAGRGPRRTRAREGR